jgi:diguanylate cyclase (GGDEF)-like protein
MRRVLGAAAIALPPLVVLAAALWLAHRPAVLPAAVAALLPAAAYGALGLAALLGLAFHRGRVVFAAAALGVGAVALGRFGAQPDLAGRAAFAGLALLGPIVLATVAWIEERGTLSMHALPRLGVIAAAVGLVWWVSASGRAETVDWAYAPLAAGPLPLATPLPQLGLASIALGLAAIAVAAVRRRSAVVSSLGWALAAFAAALHFSAAKGAAALFVAAAGFVLVIGILQETYRLAFRDELTRLPSRRALNERLQSVSRRYAIAMVDVDHFKRFNDTYGHDVGDQVLRMVAARLARVGGGGQPFRYGGEEFTVLFAAKSADDALPHLEALRADIEGYRMAIRAPDRPRQRRAGKRRRSGSPSAQAVSVTVSMGVAERSDRHDHPEAVIKAADKALYRAKRAGRNRVSG